jgi:hypothetical protein
VFFPLLDTPSFPTGHWVSNGKNDQATDSLRVKATHQPSHNSTHVVTDNVSFFDV